MRVLSIDVGIKNLALCVFDISGESWRVIEWKTVNLLAESNTVGSVSPECSCLLIPKNKKTVAKQCGKCAKFVSPLDANVTFCNKHATTNTQFIMPCKEHTETWWKKQPVADVAAEYARLINQKQQRKDEMVKEIAKYYTDRTFVPVVTKKSKTAKEVSLVEVGRAVKTALLQVSDGLDYVIIENQISTIAARMKTIQGMIAQTFIMQDSASPIEIEFISSSNKLKGLERKEQVPDGGSGSGREGSKTKYKANKKDGVSICAHFIDKNAVLHEWKHVFDSSKKKDDLADCFLQGIWFLKSRKYITYADDLGINCVK